MALGLVFVIVAVLTAVTGYFFPSVGITSMLGNGDPSPLPSWPGEGPGHMWPAATNGSQSMRGGVAHARAVDGTMLLSLAMIATSLSEFHYSGRCKANTCRR